MKYLTLLFILLFSFSVFAQENDSKILTNQGVIEMVEAEIPVSIIISKIEVSKVDFQTEIADIKNLTANGVSEEIISAMVKKSAKKPEPQKNIKYTFENAERGSISEISGKSKVCALVDDIKSREIILKAIRKQNNLQVFDGAKNCDFAIWFAMENVNTGSNIFLGTANNIVVVGRLRVYTYLPIQEGDETGRVRIVWEKDKKQDFSGGLTFDKHPANAIYAFFKDFK